MAKYGQFESYEEAPEVGPDAYRFTLENGSNVLASGPAAANLRDRLDAYSKAAGDQRTAELPAGIKLAATDAGGGVNPFTNQPEPRLTPRINLAHDDCYPEAAWERGQGSFIKQPTASELEAAHEQQSLLVPGETDADRAARKAMVEQAMSELAKQQLDRINRTLIRPTSEAENTPNDEE